MLKSVYPVDDLGSMFLHTKFVFGRVFFQAHFGLKALTGFMTKRWMVEGPVSVKPVGKKKEEQLVVEILAGCLRWYFVGVVVVLFAEIKHRYRRCIQQQKRKNEKKDA